MELRCFLDVAEELHFAGAAERLHIEQSPLSRTIKELKEETWARSCSFAPAQHVTDPHRQAAHVTLAKNLPRPAADP